MNVVSWIDKSFFLINRCLWPFCGGNGLGQCDDGRGDSGDEKMDNEGGNEKLVTNNEGGDNVTVVTNNEKVETMSKW